MTAPAGKPLAGQAVLSLQEVSRMRKLLLIAFVMVLCTFSSLPAFAGSIGPFSTYEQCTHSANQSTVPHTGCYRKNGSWWYDVYPSTSCPAPRQYSGACIQVIVWAQNPETGACCQYPTPCSAPEGWQIFYSPECSSIE
jgi:hypothetical protein